LLPSMATMFKPTSPALAHKPEDRAEHARQSVLMALDEARGEPTTHQILASAIGTGKYGFVTRRGSFALWKRGYKKDNNEQGMKLVGL